MAVEVDSRASQEHYEAADTEFARASAAYGAARAVELEGSGAPEPGNALEALERYGDPETATGRELQDEMNAAASEWESAAD